ncbi:MAG: tRNA uridine-5-carboxymethylaminomethyl(34) synthesis enzyme MnmG, partial [Ancylobacter novellus]
TRGVSEPYRMFTSRAEYRLSLRADNADQRLTARGETLGLVGAERRASFAAKSAALARVRDWSRSVSLTPGEGDQHGLTLNRDGQRRSAFDLLSYPHVSWADICRIWPEAAGEDVRIGEQVEIDAKYAVYLHRQEADIASFRRDEAAALPEMDYAGLGGISNEIKAKLESIRPRTIGQAGRIDGMTPAALALLAAHARRAK